MDLNESKVSAEAFQINGINISPLEMCLHKADQAVQIQPKVMALLVALASQSHPYMSRSDLIDLIWGYGNGSDESLTRLAYQLRKSFNSFPELRGALRTISMAGYKLEAQIEHPAQSQLARETAYAKEAQNPDLSIAVIGFTDNDLRPENQYLDDGLSRDLSRMLATTPMLWVTPHSSVKALLDQGCSKEDLPSELMCRFLLSGSFHRQGQSIRLRFELADRLENKLAWSAKYTAKLDDFFEVQNDVLLNVTTAISTRVRFALPAARVEGRAFKNDIYRIIQTTETLRYAYGPEAAREIVSLLNSGLEIDPGNAYLQAALAVQLSQNVVSQWEVNPDEARRMAFEYIKNALLSEPGNPEVTAAAGVVNAMFHRPDVAIAYLRHATDNDPNNAHARAVLGWQICLYENDASGIGLISKAEEQAPHHPRFGLWATYRATALLFMLDYPRAIQACEQAILRTPSYYQPHLSLAWALAGAGDNAAASNAIRKAESFEGPAIIGRFVVEMKKWSSNSPNAKSCAAALRKMVELQKLQINAPINAI